MKLHIVLLATLLSLRLTAEKRLPPTPEEMHAKKWEYIIQNTPLSPEEAKVVKPIYMQYEESVWEMHKKHRSGRQRTTPPDYEALNEKYIEREVKQAELLLNYHLELKKVLSPEKLYHYYKAERSHKRILIHEMHSKFQKQSVENTAK